MHDFDENSRIVFEIMRVFSTTKHIEEKIILNSSTSNFYLNLSQTDEIPKVVTLLVKVQDGLMEESRYVASIH